jgi:hypothetical protein
MKTLELFDQLQMLDMQALGFVDDFFHSDENFVGIILLHGITFCGQHFDEFIPPSAGTLRGISAQNDKLLSFRQ